MTRNTEHRTKCKVVAVINLVLAIGALIALVAWWVLKLRSEPDIGAFFGSKDGKQFIAWSGLIAGKYTVIYFLFFAVGAGLEASLAVLLFFAVIEDSFTKIKIWFLVQTVYLAAITLGFLVDLTYPRVPTLLPIFIVIIIKSISLWMVSKLVDAMKFEAHQARLISPFSPPDGNSYQGAYSPTASQILRN